MPFVKGVNATGNQLSPLITWFKPNEQDVPKDIEVKYKVKLINGLNESLYSSDNINC